MKKTKKILFLLTFILLLFSIIKSPLKIYAASYAPSVSSHAYVIMDSKSGEILYSKDPYKKIYPASTAKMMTALLAVENCNLSTKITIKESVLSNINPEATQLGLKAGSTYTLEELLHILLLYSGADAADTIAVEIAGSVDKFSEMMTKRAKSIGLSNTNFDNAIGLDFGGFNNTYSTANDIAKLTKYVMNNKTIRNIVGKSSYTIKSFNNGGSKTIKNTNKFLNDQWYPKDLYKIIGTKTGTTDKAGYVLSTTAIDSKGREIICAFFGNSTRSKMYSDIESLLTFTYKNFGSKYGWVQSNGKWYYYDKLGNLKTGWIKYKDQWYYLKSNGEMATGWVKVDNKWYYLKSSGEMATGWILYYNQWYYLTESGAMATNTTIDGWIIDGDGIATPLIDDSNNIPGTIVGKINIDS